MRISYALILASLYMGAHALPAKTSVLVLKSGDEVDCTVITKSTDTVEISIKGERKSIPMADIAMFRGRKPAPCEIRYMRDPETDPVDLASVLRIAAQGDFSHARSLLLRLVAHTPSDTNLSQALKTCNEVLSGRTREDYARSIFQGALDMLSDNYEAAIVSFNKALSISPASQEACYNLASAYQLMGFYKDAIGYYKKIYTEACTEPEIIFGLAQCYYLQEEYPLAKGYFKKLVSLHPDDPAYLAYLGASYYFMGEHEKANHHLRKACSLYKASGRTAQAHEVSSLIK